MHCNQASEHLFDFCDATQAPALPVDLHNALAEHVEGCADCQEQLADIRGFALMAEGWRDEAPPISSRALARSTGRSNKPRFALPVAPRWSQWLPLAAGIVLSMAVLFQTRIYTDDAGWTVAFGPIPIADMQAELDALRDEQAQTIEALIATNRSERMLLTREFLTATRQQREDEMGAVMSVVSTKMEQQAEEMRAGFRFLMDHQMEDQRQLNELSDALIRINHIDREAL